MNGSEPASDKDFAGRIGRVFKGYVALMPDKKTGHMFPWAFSESIADAEEFLQDVIDYEENDRRGSVAYCEVFVPVHEGNPSAIERAAAHGLDRDSFLLAMQLRDPA